MTSSCQVRCNIWNHQLLSQIPKTYTVRQLLFLFFNYCAEFEATNICDCALATCSIFYVYNFWTCMYVLIKVTRMWLLAWAHACAWACTSENHKITPMGGPSYCLRVQSTRESKAVSCNLLSFKAKITCLTFFFCAICSRKLRSDPAPAHHRRPAHPSQLSSPHAFIRW